MPKLLRSRNGNDSRQGLAGGGATAARDCVAET